MDASCWICGGPVAPLAALEPHPFVRCTACGFVFRPDLDEDATREVYEGGAYEERDFAVDYAADDTVDERRDNARTRIRFVRTLADGGRLLDVGAAGGAFVLEAREAGFDAFGVEPAPAFARHAREVLGVDVRDGRIEDLDLPDGTLDVVTAWHVLEHVPRPVAALERICGALRSGGRVVLEVPNLDSVIAGQMGPGWTHLDPSVHANQFTPGTLRDALERAGFSGVETHTVAHGTYLGIRERLAPGHLVHRLQLARGGAPRLRHPSRHELLRATARA